MRCTFAFLLIYIVLTIFSITTADPVWETQHRGERRESELDRDLPFLLPAIVLV